jgi:hypothetical protein
MELLQKLRNAVWRILRDKWQGHWFLSILVLDIDFKILIFIWLYKAKHYSRDYQLYSHSTTSQHFMEPEGSLPHSQGHHILTCKIIVAFVQFILKNAFYWVTDFIGSLIYNFCSWIYNEENVYINTVYMGSSLEFLLNDNFGRLSSFKWKR